MSFQIKLVVYFLIAVVVLLALLLVTGVIQPFKQATFTGDLAIWDTSQHNDVLSAFLSSYQSQFKGVKIAYSVKNPETFEHDLLDALASGNGPDIFVTDTQSLPSYQNKITPLAPGSTFAKEFLAKAPDVALADLVDGAGNIYGMPISIDTLALYYNKDHLNSANISEPPKTWDEFQDQSRRLTRRSPTGVVQRSGASFGLGSNVNYALDILSALFLQSGNPIYTAKDNKLHLSDTVVLGAEQHSPVTSALQFFTDFANPNSAFYTWSSVLPESRSAFAEGRAAFYIGYARDLPVILAENPHLNFAIVPLPQLSFGDKTSYASYEVFTVAKGSKSPDLAWSLISALFQPSVQKYLDDGLGLPPAHRDLIAGTPPNKVLQPFYDQVLSARSWRILDAKTVAKIFRDMADSVISQNVPPRTAVSQAETKMEALYRSLVKP